MEPLSLLQEHVTCPYPEPREPSLLPPILL
jgi:hypothetical protein